MSDGSSPPDIRADYRLFDRVVCAREGFTVPVGLRGTVVGIHPGRFEGDLKLSVIFDEEFIGGVNIRNEKNNGYHILASALVNLSYGVRLEDEKKMGKQEATTSAHQTVKRQPSGSKAVQPKKEERNPTNQSHVRQPAATPVQIKVMAKNNQPASRTPQVIRTFYVRL